MSTNYYVTGPGCAAENPDDPGLHLGKSAAGWDYLFRGHPALGLTSVAAWRAFLDNDSRRKIVSESGATFAQPEFWEMALRRPADVTPPLRAWGSGAWRGVYSDTDAGCPFDNQPFS